jgi:type IV secretion system protein TrbL
MSLVLASIALFGLGIFGPGIAAGLLSGAPQLGAGAAIGTIGGVAAATFLAGGAAIGAARLGAAGGLAAIRAGTTVGSGAATAYQLGRATSGAGGIAGLGAGLAGVARAGAGSMAGSARTGTSGIFAESAAAGRQAAWRAGGGRPMDAHGAVADGPFGGAPGWARRMRTEQRLRAHTFTAMQAIREGDRPGSGANPELGE